MKRQASFRLAKGAVAAALVAVGALVVTAVGGRPEHVVPAAADESVEQVEVPYRDRPSYQPSSQTTEPVEPPEPAAAAVAPPRLPPRPDPIVPGVDLPVRQAPAAPPQTASAWIASYRDAVCSCATRGCVRELQARFVRAVDTADYESERDGAAYAEASRQAIQCYASLPASS